MNNFEFIDPADTLPRHLAAVGLDLNVGSRPAVRAALGRDAGSAAASRPALRRHGDLPGAARRRRAARERQHARPRRRAVGQGRLRRHGDRQGRSARPRHDGGAAGRARAGQRRTHDDQRRAAEHATFCKQSSHSATLVQPSMSSISRICRRTIRPSTRCCCEADTIGVFQVESRAQMATLPRLKPDDVLRPRRAGGDHPARADRRADGASVSEPPRRARAGASTRIRRSSRSSRARSACRCFRSSCCAWRWSPPASPAGRPRSCGARSASSDPSGG